MNRYQTSIIWLGLILIALNIIVNISEFKSVIFSGGSSSTTATATNSSAKKTPSNVTV